MQAPVIVKAKYGDDLRRISVSQSISYSDFVRLITDLFQLQEPVVMKYADDDGDLVTLASDPELAEAFRIALASATNLRLTLTVKEKSSSPTKQDAPTPQTIPSAATDNVMPLLQTLLSNQPQLMNQMLLQSQQIYPIIQSVLNNPALMQQMLNMLQTLQTPQAAPQTNPVTLQAPPQLTEEKPVLLEDSKKLPKRRLSSSVVRGLTLEDDSACYPPGVRFPKTWILKNDGNCAWPEDTILTFVRGTKLDNGEKISVPAALPGKEVEVSILVNSPKANGRYIGYYGLYSAKENKQFGTVAWIDLTVKLGEPLATPNLAEKGPYGIQMGQLETMGFGSKETNRKLLEKYSGDIAAVVNDLLRMNLQ